MEAWWRGDAAARVAVRNTFGEPQYLWMAYFFRCADQFSYLENKALSFCRGHVLDVGAGAGSHALYLQNKGLRVTALDVAPKAVEIMRRRGVRQTLSGDYFQLTSRRRYDTLLFLMNGIGVAGTLTGLESAFHHAATLLAPGGQMLLDSSDLAYQVEEAALCYALAPEQTTYYGEITFQLQHRNLVGHAYPWLFVDFPTLAHVAEQCGFLAEKLHEAPNHQYLARCVRA
jgi:SAM-dependent methyltransferase